MKDSCNAAKRTYLPAYIFGILVLLFLLVPLSGCEQEEEDHAVIFLNLDCEKFSQDLIAEDVESVKNTLLELLDQFTPEPVEEDEFGHKENFVILLKLLNEECPSLSFGMSCYACIETYPPITEIQVFFPDDGKKVLDIRTSDSKPLELVDIHG